MDSQVQVDKNTFISLSKAMGVDLFTDNGVLCSSTGARFKLDSGKVLHVKFVPHSDGVYMLYFNHYI